jgi:hypothetical protein
MWNMYNEPRKEPGKIKILKILDKRMGLPSEEKQRYLNLVKGFEGEVLFDSLTSHLENKFFILKDLLLEQNKTKFQIDSLIITEASVLHCEVKNYQGDYIYKGDDFFPNQTEQKITNPLHQIDRAQTLLRQLLQKNGFRYPIESHVIFVNPEFYLYNAPLNKPIIYPTQIKKFLKYIDSKPSNLNSNHRNLVDFLLNRQLTESPYEQLPPYKYTQFQKGNTCAFCQSFSITIQHKWMICADCRHQEKTETAVLRSVEELKLLFPEIKLTTNLVNDWCQSFRSEKSYLKILKQNFSTIGYGKWTYYE